MCNCSNCHKTYVQVPGRWRIYGSHMADDNYSGRVVVLPFCSKRCLRDYVLKGFR